MHELMTLISWPNGSIWDNVLSQLLASVLTGVITYVKLKRKHRQHTDELIDRLERIEQRLEPAATALPRETIEIIEEPAPEPFRLVL